MLAQDRRLDDGGRWAAGACEGGRPPTLDLEQIEQIEQITAALDGGASKASVCRTFKVPRSTLLDTLARVGWAAPAKA